MNENQVQMVGLGVAFRFPVAHPRPRALPPSLPLRLSAFGTQTTGPGGGSARLCPNQPPPSFMSSARPTAQPAPARRRFRPFALQACMCAGGAVMQRSPEDPTFPFLL